MTKEWFGLSSQPNEKFYLSQISLYPKALTEDEFINTPVLFEEMPKEQQRTVKAAYNTFFGAYIKQSRKLVFSDKKNMVLPGKREFNDFDITNFLVQANLQAYIDTSRSIIFQTEPCLEIIVYSKSAFRMINIAGLYQRTVNMPVKWKDTDWA